MKLVWAVLLAIVINTVTIVYAQPTEEEIHLKSYLMGPTGLPTATMWISGKVVWDLNDVYIVKHDGNYKLIDSPSSIHFKKFKNINFYHKDEKKVILESVLTTQSRDQPSGNFYDCHYIISYTCDQYGQSFYSTRTERDW